MQKEGDDWAGFIRHSSKVKANAGNCETQLFSSAQTLLRSLTHEWQSVWKLRNPAHWVLIAIGAAEGQASFHWDLHNRKPGSLAVCCSITGAHELATVYSAAVHAGFVPSGFRPLSDSMCSSGRMLHSVRRGPFADDWQSLQAADFAHKARNVYEGNTALPQKTNYCDLLNHFIDGVNPVNGLRYILDAPELFHRTVEPTEQYSEFRPPSEWRIIFGQHRSRNGEPLSAETWRQWRRKGTIRTVSKSERLVAVMLEDLPVSVRSSENLRDALVASVEPVRV